MSEVTQATHTPGDWEYRKGLPEGITTYDFKDNPYPSGPIPPHIVAVKYNPEPGITRATSFICDMTTMAHDKDGSEMESNARLIAAAPKLLEALVGIRSWAEGVDATSTEQLIRGIAERAIAKATKATGATA